MGAPVPQVTVRARRDSDLDAIERVAHDVHASNGYPRYLPQSMRDFLSWEDALGAWVATIDDVAGHVALHRRSARQVMAVARRATGLEEDDLAVIAGLLVSPKRRWRGVARALFDTAWRHAVSLGRRAVLAIVTDQVAAIRLYEGCGWARADALDWELPGGSPLVELVFDYPRPLPVTETGPRRK